MPPTAKTNSLGGRIVALRETTFTVQTAAGLILEMLVIGVALRRDGWCLGGWPASMLGFKRGRLAAKLPASRLTALWLAVPWRRLLAFRHSWRGHDRCCRLVGVSWRVIQSIIRSLRGLDAQEKEFLEHLAAAVLADLSSLDEAGLLATGRLGSTEAVLLGLFERDVSVKRPGAG